MGARSQSSSGKRVEIIFPDGHKESREICTSCGAYQRCGEFHPCPDALGYGRTFGSAFTSNPNAAPLEAVNMTLSDIIVGETQAMRESPYAQPDDAKYQDPENPPTDPPSMALLDPKDPTVLRIIASAYEAHDSAMALGQRVISLESEVNAMRGELAALVSPQRSQAMPPFPPGYPYPHPRPSHCSQIQPVSDADLRDQINRWLAGR